MSRNFQALYGIPQYINAKMNRNNSKNIYNWIERREHQAVRFTTYVFEIAYANFAQPVSINRKDV